MRNNEQGFVSLFSVIFFMLLITIITLGFLRIMVLEQRQSLDNDLSASALAAAESGVEDGKRAILKYLQLPDSDPLKNQLRSALNSTDCNSLVSSASIRNALQLSAEGNAIGNEQLNQYYTCLNVQLNTPDYKASSSAGTSKFIPLKTSSSGGFDRIKLSWHLLSENIGNEGDGIPDRYSPGNLLPPLHNTHGDFNNSWSAQGYPSYLRVQLYGHPNGSFDRGDLDERSRTVFLVPSDSSNVAALGESDVINFETSDPRGMYKSKNVLKQIKCRDNPGSQIGSYACTATLQLPNGSLGSNNNNYFLRVTPIYGQSHFQLSLQDGSNPVMLREVQPIIDVTGRAADVFRRLQARVSLNGVRNMPEFVVESANSICKNMEVADSSYFQPNNCP